MVATADFNFIPSANVTNMKKGMQELREIVSCCQRLLNRNEVNKSLIIQLQKQQNIPLNLVNWIGLCGLLLSYLKTLTDKTIFLPRMKDFIDDDGLTLFHEMLVCIRKIPRVRFYEESMSMLAFLGKLIARYSKGVREEIVSMGILTLVWEIFAVHKDTIREQWNEFISEIYDVISLWSDFRSGFRSERFTDGFVSIGGEIKNVIPVHLFILHARIKKFQNMKPIGLLEELPVYCLSSKASMFATRKFLEYLYTERFSIDEQDFYFHDDPLAGLVEDNLSSLTTLLHQQSEQEFAEYMVDKRNEKDENTWDNYETINGARMKGVNKTTRLEIEMETLFKRHISGELKTNFRIIARDGYIFCDQALLSFRSSYFNNSISFASETKSITVDDCSKKAMQCIIAYLYMGLNKKMKELLTSDVVIECLLMSDRFMLLPLKREAEFRAAMFLEKANLFDLLHISDLYNCPNLLEKCTAFKSRLSPEVIKILEEKWKVDNENSDALSPEVVASSTEHFDNLSVQKEELLSISSIYTSENKELSFEIIGDSSVSITYRYNDEDIIVNACLPSSYPSINPPDISIISDLFVNSSEINSKLSQLHESMLEPFTPGEPFLFDMIQIFLEEIPELLNVIEFKPKPKETTVNPTVSKPLIPEGDDVISKLALKEISNVVIGTKVKVLKSVFLAFATYNNRSLKDIRSFFQVLNCDKRIANSTHHMTAYRFVDQGGKTYFEADADGETGADKVMMNIIDRCPIENVCISVIRWYGGIKLGSQRFRIIANCTKEVLEKISELES